ncbi:hypothetical protein WLF18_08875 [Pseudomonas shirazensis]|uniref:Secreted protein n=1 Tax=Pseudomonas shirazensis TaxID=2745494 RepID=A0ABU9A0E7_9PSED
MKLEIARTFFLVSSLAVTTVAFAAWEQPRPTVFSKSDLLSQCPPPRNVKAQVTVQPDQDLLLLLFGLRQGVRPFG